MICCQVWFRCIAAKEKKSQGDHGFGKILQDAVLKTGLELRAEKSNEWHLCFKQTAKLQTITQKLDHAITTVQTVVHGKNINVDVREFETDEAAIKWFQEKLGT